MATLYDYLDWRGDISFSEHSLCEIDALIFSLLCYVDLNGIVTDDTAKNGVTLNSAAKQYFTAHKGEKATLGAIVPAETLTLLAKAAKTRRYANVRLSCYVNNVDPKTQTQFSALTYKLCDGETFIAFRGTDDTLVGWKENFNMSFMETVPAQLEAAEYLAYIAKKVKGDLYVGGHSKGGNLAVFSAVEAKKQIRERLCGVFSFDGPGFSEGFIKRREYLDIKPKIRLIIPHGAIIGLLLEQDDNYEVVKSRNNGILQHNAFSWELLGSRFIYLNDISKESKKIEKNMREWLRGMDIKQREELFSAIYQVFSGTDATTLSEINSDKLRLVKAWTKLDAKTRNILLSNFSKLFKTFS